MATAYLFPGQGSQYVGMGRNLYQQSPHARRLFDEADDLLGLKISEIAFSGPQERLTETAFQQPALFVASIANWQAMKEEDDWPEPDYFAGHSLGEFAALVAAGSLQFEDGLRLVRRRGELMRDAGQTAPGAMAAILGLTAGQVEEICRQASGETLGTVQLANDNCPGQLVISGDTLALERASRLAEEAGARRVVQLPISIAAHSPLMAPVAAQFAQEVDRSPIRAPMRPLIGNVSGLPLSTADEIASELKAQLTAPVVWTSGIQYLLDQGVDQFIEVGPGDVLLSLVKRIDRQTKRRAFDTGPDQT